MPLREKILPIIHLINGRVPNPYTTKAGNNHDTEYSPGAKTAFYFTHP